MKIKQITMSHVQLPMKFNFETAKGMLKLRDTIIIKAEGYSGGSGFGEVVSFTTPFYTAETLDASWKKLEQDYIPHILSNVFSHPFEIHDYFENPLPMALAGLENAMLDLYFKEKNENLIQGIFQEQLNTEIQRGAVLGHMPLSQLEMELQALVNSGVKRVKLKISPKDGFERTKFAVENFPELRFAVDANRSFPLEKADEIEKFDALNLICIEEPFDIDDLGLLTDLSAKIQTPICFDESVQTLETLKSLPLLPFQPMLNIKVGRLGGLFQTQKAISFCRENQIPFWIGSMVESGISKILHVQLAGLADNAMAGDLSDSQHYFDEDLILPEIAFSDGKMTVPTGAGLGVAINETALERYTIRKEIFQ